MYRIPKTLDLGSIVGEFTTQLRVGQFDLQFTFGGVSFTVESPVRLFRAGKVVAYWEGGRWPDSGFFDVMNSKVTQWKVIGDRLIVIEFETGLEMHLEDSSDEYESMQILFVGNSSPLII